MVRSLKEDSSNSGQGKSTAITNPRAAKAPHWRIEKKNYVHKDANPGEFKVYIRSQFCESPLEVRYCKAKYSSKPDCRDEQINVFLDELKATGLVPDKGMDTINLAVDAIFSMKGDCNSLRSMFGADYNIYKRHAAITVRTAIPEYTNVDKLQGAHQILIYPNDWSKF
ncbi:unnamed protein product [Bursaphelenchus xylophilus]|uniref:(pine wood nematode) hypothetical protein n=1 Tax=Bursaphelenchus xylophilus TaxID=6326 RepID=A0A1I7S2K0_BURXY|nr:unnamed protein product [Bursaphelenchus xylophilus]CAG9121897.1 unnamed protein product [Bursaphelenchus xylophilus]